MKKQLRFVLFALLVTVMIVMTALVASAATDGAATYEDGHAFYVTDADGAPTATPYYTTLSAAVGAVPENGTVYLLGDLTLTAPETLPASKTYTLDGDVTKAITGATKGADADGDGRYAISGSYLVIGDTEIPEGEGKTVYLKNLAVTNTAINAVATYTLGTLELTNCSITAAGSPIVLMSAATLNLRGTANVVTNTRTAVGNVAHSEPAKTVEGGSPILPQVKGYTILIEGGVFNAPYAFYTKLAGHLTVQGGTFTTSAADGAFYLIATNIAATQHEVFISGATVYGNALLFYKSGNYKVTFANLTFNATAAPTQDAPNPAKPAKGIVAGTSTSTTTMVTNPLELVLNGVTLDVLGDAISIARRSGNSTTTIENSSITAGGSCFVMKSNKDTVFNVKNTQFYPTAYAINLLGKCTVTSQFDDVTVTLPQASSAAALHIYEDIELNLVWSKGAITGAAVADGEKPAAYGIVMNGKESVSITLDGVAVTNVYVGVEQASTGVLALTVKDGTIHADCVAILFTAQAPSPDTPSSITLDGAELTARTWQTIRTVATGVTNITAKGNTVVSTAKDAAVHTENGTFGILIENGTFIGGMNGSALNILGTASVHIKDGTFKRENPQSKHNIVNIDGVSNGILVEGGTFLFEDTPEKEFELEGGGTKVSVIKGDFATFMVCGTCADGATVKITGGTFRQMAENIYGYCMWFEVAGMPVIFEEAEDSTILVEAYSTGIRINADAPTTLTVTGGTYRANLSTATREELEALGYMDIYVTTGEGDAATTELVSGGISWRLTSDTNPTFYNAKAACALTLTITDAVIVNPKANAVHFLGGDDTARTITLQNNTVYAYSLLRLEAGRYDVILKDMTVTKATEDPEDTRLPQYIVDARKGTQLNLTVDGGNFSVGTKNGICFPINSTNTKTVLTDTDGREYTGVITIKGGAVLTSEAKIINVSVNCVAVKIVLLDCTLTANSNSSHGAIHTESYKKVKETEGGQEVEKVYNVSSYYRHIEIDGAVIAGYNAIRMYGGTNTVIIRAGELSSVGAGSAVYGVALNLGDKQTGLAAFYDITVLDGAVFGGTLGNCFDLRSNYKISVSGGTLTQAKAQNYYHILNLQGTCHGISITGGVFEFTANPDPRNEDGTAKSGTSGMIRIAGDVARDPVGNPIAEAVISGGSYLCTVRGIFTTEANQKKNLYSNNIYFLYHSATDVKTTISNVTVRSTGGIYLNGASTIDIESGTFTNKPTFSHSTRFIAVAKDGAVINVKGGEFKNNANAYVVFSLRTKGAELHFTGGVIEGGGRWINQEQPSLVTVSEGTVFRNLDAHNGFQLNKNATGEIGEGRGVGRMEITGGSFIVPINCEFPLFVMTGAEAIISGGHFETTYTMFHLTSNAGVGTVRISGGDFMIHDNGNLFQFVVNLSSSDPAKSLENLAAMPGLIHITGGSFASENTAVIFKYAPSHPGARVLVEGGTFETQIGWVLWMEDSASDFVINGGTFTTNHATAMIQVGQNNAGTLYIKDGTFNFMDTDQLGKKADTALLYSVGKSKSFVVIEGGEFYDYRMGSNQVFLKLNEYGKIDFRGNFKVYSAEKKAYFYQNYADLYGDSIEMGKYTPVSFIGNYNFYTLMGHDGGNAPVMQGNPVLRPGFKDLGITFVSTVSKSAADALAALGTVSYGTLVFPTEYLYDWSETTDFLAALQEYAANTGKPENKVYLMIAASAGLVTNKDGSLTIRASLINIKKENQQRAFTGIAYAKVTAPDGTVTYHFATANSGASTTTFSAELKGAINDTATRVKYSADGARAYCYPIATGKNGYSRFPAKMQEVFMSYFKED